MIAGRGGSAEDWSACQKAIIKLALKYPKSMLRERAGVFYNTLRQRQNGQSNQKIAFASAFLLYEGEPTQDDQKSFLQDSAAVQPLNKELRRAFIVDMASSTDFAGGLIDLTWWMLPPFVLLGLALAVLLVQRRWMLFLPQARFCTHPACVFDRAGHLLYVLSDAVYCRVCGGGGCGAVRSAETEIEIGKDHGLMLALFCCWPCCWCWWAMRSACCGGSSSSAFMSARPAGRCCAAWPAAMR